VDQSENLWHFVDSIGQDLLEWQHLPRKQIFLLLKLVGKEFVFELLSQTLEIEENGGILFPNSKHRRTPGGVFFHLARQQLTRKLRNQIFGVRKQQDQKNQNKPAPPPPASTSQYPPFVWDDRLEFLNELINEHGELKTVKVTLIGRPGKVEKRQDLVVTAMVHILKQAAMPKGIPALPQTPTVYTVYIGAKQWNKVETAIENAEDALIVEGVCAFDPEINAMAVFASNVSTKLLDQAKRQPKQDKEAEAKPQEQPASEVKTLPAPPVPKEPETAKNPIPATLPPQVEAKLKDLYAAAGQFRTKLAALEKKPANQRPGYEMTQKLLANTEKQIEALLQQYG
jgi:hypothetical protein